MQVYPVLLLRSVSAGGILLPSFLVNQKYLLYSKQEIMQNSLSKAQDMLMLLSNVASGEHMSSYSENYKSLRLELISETQTKVLLPSFIRSCRMINDFWDYIQPLYGTYKERRNHLREQFDPLLTFLEQKSVIPHYAVITDSIHTLSCESANYLWSKALSRTENDADGAITAARSLIESVCKQILVERNVDYNDSYDLPKLYKLTSKSLNLAPENHGEDVFKQILGGLLTTVYGFASLRNKFSDAHGQTTGYRVSKRHAAFAVHLAGSMVSFLIQTHHETVVKSTRN